MLFVEATFVPSAEERLILTGMLGDVMRESAQAVLSFVRSNARELGIDPARFERTTVHLHVPAGAIPKDGPSAGVAMVVALASLGAGRPVRSDVAMTRDHAARSRPSGRRDPRKGPGRPSGGDPPGHPPAPKRGRP